jgi:hypothetical protein
MQAMGTGGVVIGVGPRGSRLSAGAPYRLQTVRYHQALGRYPGRFCCSMYSPGEHPTSSLKIR